MSDQWSRRFDRLEPGDQISVLNQKMTVVAVMGRVPGAQHPDGTRFWEIAVTLDPEISYRADTFLIWPENRWVQGYGVEPIQRAEAMKPCVHPSRAVASAIYTGLPIWEREIDKREVLARTHG